MLSQSAQYALRIMAYIALYEGELPLRAKDIAEETNIPVFYLSKVLRRMVTAGLLSGSKGHGGGFLIAQPPHKIRFVDIVSAIEGDERYPLCVFGWDTCSDKHPCVLHDQWKEAKHAFQCWAKKTTLADLKKNLRTSEWPGKELSSLKLRR